MTKAFSGSDSHSTTDATQQSCQIADMAAPSPTATMAADNPLLVKALNDLYLQATKHGLTVPRLAADIDQTQLRGDWPLHWRAKLAQYLADHGQGLSPEQSPTEPTILPHHGLTEKAGQQPSNPLHLLPGGYRFDASRLQLLCPTAKDSAIDGAAAIALRLTGREGQLLLQLLANPNGLTRQQMVQQWYGRATNMASDSRVFEAHLYRLRQKLGRLHPAVSIDLGPDGYRLSPSVVSERAGAAVVAGVEGTTAQKAGVDGLESP
ncbi:MAG: helix-turn-helix domain-containing protein [Alphaproteobacteria bacterium]|nr:helix-turn-helix domain-containing protein [Alphaproteobacteria bacterium]